MIGLNKSSGLVINDIQDHVRQSIADILTTPIGSRVMRRDYGSLIPDLIDAPLNQATVLRLYAATAGAIMRWEPRFRISSIALYYQAPAGAVIDIVGSVKDEFLQTSVVIQNRVASGAFWEDNLWGGPDGDAIYYFSKWGQS
ncbi:GPW/gp25 family protein [Marinobacterium sedimentorum]|uniref:GPW/gp25 family protein n=1 Tax=Marinobacterium sedimentorum TaxID=2927804 RepID=UPI0020C6811C|nr:GPW/gp25 family protein [Marinobacterium sedimentorum]MCP8687752.1 GPW/gp25 family protein [Marinobacterium sedimentorum]